MDKSTKNVFQDTSEQTVRELHSQLFPKRRRTDWANSCTEMFCKTVCCPSSASTLQMTANLTSTDKCGIIVDEEPCATAVIVNLIANLSTSHARDAPMGAPEGCPLALLTDELPLDAEFVKLCQHLQDNTGGELAETHTSPDSCTNTSNHSDCKLWRDSFEDNPPRGCNLSSRNGLEGRQVVSGVSEIQVLNCSGKTWHPAESFQGKDKHIFREIPSKEEVSAENSFLAYIHHTDKNVFYSNIKDSKNLADGVKNERDELELQIFKNGNVTSCEEKGTANAKGLNRSTIHRAAQCAEGSIVTYVVASAGKMATENVGIEDDVLCWAKGEHAAGEMIAEAGRKDTDHPAETSLPAGIGHEHAVGDNDAGRFSVIDPAICRETDRESEGTHCYSESCTDANLVSSLKVHRMEAPPAFGSDIMSRLQKHRGEIQECKDEKDNPCRPYKAPLVCFISADRKQDKTGEESGGCCSLEHHLANDKETVEHLPKVRTQSGCFPVISNEAKTPGDDTQVELVCEYTGSQVNVTEKHSFNIPTCQHPEALNPMDKVQRLGQYDEHGEYDNNTEWRSDHMYCAVCPLNEETIEDNSNSHLKTKVNSKTSLIQEVVQSPNMAPKKPQDVCVGEMSKGTSESQAVGRPEVGRQSVCFSDCRLTEEPVTVDYLTSGDALVPSELTPSLNTRDDPTARNDTDRSPPLSGELESFERIQLLLNNDCSWHDSSCTIHFNSIGDVVMTNEWEVTSQKEEQKSKQGEEKQHQNTSTTNRSEKCDYSPNEDQDLTKPVAPACIQTDSPTACSLSGSWFSLLDVLDDLDPQASDLNHLPKFEMKRQFDMVLKELNLYFDISINDSKNYKCQESFPEQLKDLTETTKRKISCCSNEKLSSRDLKHQRDALLGK